MIARQTVDLDSYPDLVVIYLGMRVQAPRGLVTLLKTGREIQAAVDARPAGLLLHENLYYGLFPPHVGMRQYWRDFESLEAWARALPHRKWWQDFLKDPRGTAFWHETYFRRGEMESIFVNAAKPIGMMQFAPGSTARGSMFSARKRLRREGESPATPVAEEELYRGQ